MGLGIWGASSLLILLCFCISCKLNLFEIVDSLLAKSMERWQDNLAISVLILVVLLPPCCALGNVWALDRCLKYQLVSKLSCKFCHLPTKTLKNMLLQIKNSSITFKKEPTICRFYNMYRVHLQGVMLHISFMAWLCFTQRRSVPGSFLSGHWQAVFPLPAHQPALTWQLHICSSHI